MAISDWYCESDEGIDRQIKDIIRTAVEDQRSDINDAAEVLDEAVFNGPEDYISDMWAFFVLAAEQLPHNSSSQDKLVQLMSRLRYGPDKRNTGWNDILSSSMELVEDIQGMYQ